MDRLASCSLLSVLFLKAGDFRLVSRQFVSRGELDEVSTTRGSEWCHRIPDQTRSSALPATAGWYYLIQVKPGLVFTQWRSEKIANVLSLFASMRTCSAGDST